MDDSDPDNRKEGGFVSSAAVGDEPTPNDQLGFEPYVDAVETFLTDENTDPPLTISVEGEWGTGKSSFLLQLENKLSSKDKLTVRFNPWRHEDEENLWAAFVLEFLDQIRGQLSFDKKLVGDFRLMWYRLSQRDKPLKTVRFIGFGLLLTIFSIALPIFVYILNIELLIPFIQTNFESYSTIISILSGGSGLAVTAVAIVSLWSTAIENLRRPLEIEIEEYLQNPNYEERVSFISQFHRDFERILNAYSKEKRVYIFIDDLDRCEIPKSANLIQSINLMIAQDPRLVFIMGMDREKVAAGIATKYEDVIPYLSTKNQNTNSSQHSKAEINAGLEFGYDYLNKFIQIPFRVPKPKPEDIDRLIQSTVNETQTDQTDVEEFEKQFGDDGIRSFDTRGRGTSRSDQLGKDALNYLNEHGNVFQEIIVMISPSLGYNPRQIKRFVNLFRLRVLLAQKDGLFEFTEDGQLTENGLSLQQLGKFVAISLQWPRIISDLADDPDLFKELEEFASGDLTDDLSPSGQLWGQEKELLNLLTKGIGEGDKYRLSNVPIESLLHVSPQTSLPSEKDTPQPDLNPGTQHQINSSRNPPQGGTGTAPQGGTRRPQGGTGEQNPQADLTLSQKKNLRQQLIDAYEGADYPVNSPMDLVPALPNGPRTEFSSGDFSMTAIELNTQTSGAGDFPYEDVESFVDDIMEGLEDEDLI